MKKFIVERDFPGAGKLSKEELKKISDTSCGTVSELGEPYLWIHSFVTDNKIYCIHIAESEEVVRKHSLKSGFPVDNIMEVKAVFDPMKIEKSA